jgi:hypothetical protein
VKRFLAEGVKLDGQYEMLVVAMVGYMAGMEREAHM